jgi:hypothetical protein
MTDIATATEPTTQAAEDTVPAGLYSEHVNLMIDVETRAYFLGRAMLEAKAKGYRDPREAATVRAALDLVLAAEQQSAPAAYAKAVKAGRAELKRRAEVKAERRRQRGSQLADAIAHGKLQARQ